MMHSALPGIGRQPQGGYRPQSVGNQLRSLASEARVRRNCPRDLKAVRHDSSSSLKAKAAGSTRAERRKRAKHMRFLTAFPCFRGFTHAQLDLILEHAKRRELEPEDLCCRQGSPGREFLFIEKGEAIVSRRDDPSDPREDEKFLPVVRAPHAIEPVEVRNETVTASATGLSVLQVTKDQYNNIRDLNQTLVMERALAIIGNIQPFCNIAEANLMSLAGKMKSEHFKPGVYICEQGQAGHTFYIIMSGACRVTINRIDATTGRRKELKVNEMHADSFFGEVALMHKNETRTANVIAETDVNVLSLHRAVFDLLMHKHMDEEQRADFMKAVAVRNLKVFSGQKGTGSRAKWEALEDRWSSAEKVPGKSGQLPSKMIVLTRRIMLAYDFSLFRRCWQEMAKLFSRGSHEQLKHYGATAAAIAKIRTQRTACIRLRSKLYEALQEKPADRTKEHRAIACACTFSVLKDEKEGLCKSWENHHFTDLCGMMRIQELAPGQMIFDANETIGELYLIMRGIVLIYSIPGVAGLRNGVSQLSSRGVFKAMLRPGQVLGANVWTTEELMRPNALREKRRVRAYALTAVDLVAWDARKFDAIMRSTKADLSYDAKMKFILGLPVFSEEAELNKIAAIAALLRTEELRRGQVVLEAGDISSKLTFIVEGTVDVFAESVVLPDVHGGSTSSTQPWTKVTSLGSGEYFGDSGVLSFLSDKRKDHRESTRVVAAGDVVCLSLEKANYSHLTKGALRRIKENFGIRASWRGARLLESQRALTSIKASMAESGTGEEVDAHIKTLLQSGSSENPQQIPGREQRAKHRGTKLSVAVPQSIEVARADKLAALKRSRTRFLSYQRSLSDMSAMTVVSISEPSMRNRPSHWFGSGRGRKAKGKGNKGRRREDKEKQIYANGHVLQEDLFVQEQKDASKTNVLTPLLSDRRIDSKGRSSSRGPIVSMF